MPTCGVTLCGRVVGVAIGGHTQTNTYVAGPLGWSMSGYADWVGGGSCMLPGSVAAVVVDGGSMGKATIYA
ncbi:hypothetical protein [Sorangium sp. So ce693]|uniref:hypothetical protein n=1 Tax=Sorangium sp. So ce693 TaxID=3133318 RepID=UPI003F63F46E